MVVRVLAVAAAVLVVAAQAAAAAPTVTVVSRSPLELRGAAFRPGIVVTVTAATQDGRIVRRVRTSPAGRFNARFAVAVDACHGVTSAAISTPSGYRLSLRLAPRGACAPIQPIDQ
jgi:hypothetical protein